jgi:S-adenosylmethionine hydrolase
MSQPVITLITDFGQSDTYAGIMKGVMLGICPEAVLVDLTHDIAPQAIRQAAYLLHTATPYFPAGTVHLIVVDPGVGSARRPIAVLAERAIYVAPDNGVLTATLEQDPPRMAVHLTEQKYQLPPVSDTFHGRDIFAPAAAHLAAGIDLQQMGKEIEASNLVRLPTQQPILEADGSLLGKVQHIDHFGNLITTLKHSRLSSPVRIRISSETIPELSRTFADVAPGMLVAYVGSSGFVEIAVRDGNAAALLGVAVGSPVYLDSHAQGTVDSATEQD